MSSKPKKTASSQLIQDVQMPSPVKPSSKTERYVAKLRRWRPKSLKVSRKQLIVVPVILIVLIGVIVASRVSQAKVPPIPQQFTQNRSYKLSHPDKLPKDIAFEPEETSIEKDAVITKFTDTIGKGSIYLTQQSRPQQTDLKQIDAQETYLADVGAVYILKGEREHIQAIIETNDSWILVDSSASIGITKVKEVIAGLK